MLPSKHKEARASGDKYFTGKPCRRGHVVFRYSNGSCSNCVKENNVAWKAANPAKGKDTSEAWRKKHQFYVTAKAYQRREQDKEASRRAERQRGRSRKQRRGLLPVPLWPCPELCENCGRLPNAGKALAIDHDHATLKFRGWLCFDCNTGFGKLGDTVEGLKRGIAYLERSLAFS